MEIELYQLRQMLKDAVEHGIKACLIETGQDKPFISQRRAWKIYGKSLVELWRANQIITPEQHGGGNNMIRYSKLELDRAYKTHKRI